MRKSVITLIALVGLAALVFGCGSPGSNSSDGGDVDLPVAPGAGGSGGDSGSDGEAEQTLPPGTITDSGELLVGTDIKPGTYRGVECDYWARLKNGDGDLDSILANGNAARDEYVTITILKSDYAFDNSCAALMPISYLRTVPKKSTTSDVFGTLVVGKDIHPGTWRGKAVDHCYWARLSGFTGDFDDIRANDNVDAGAKFTITVKTSDKGVHIDSSCGQLTKVS